MLDAEFLKELPDEVVDVWHACETDLLCDIAKRIQDKDYLIPSSIWKLNKLKDIGLHQDYINRVLAKTSKKSEKEVFDIMAKAFNEGLRSDNAVIKHGLGKLEDIKINADALNPIASKGIKAVNDEIRNFTKTYAARVSQKYEWSIDKAFLNVQSGFMTPEQAKQRVIEELFTHTDLPDLVTINGRHEQISTVVGRAIRTGTNQTMAKIQIANCEELECDLVEVSSHYGARPSHAEWQGQIYSLSGKSSKYPDLVTHTGYGGIDGLCGINCRHSFYPFFEGISTKSFKEIDPNENARYYVLKDKERHLNNRVKALTKKAKVLRAGGVNASKEITKTRLIKEELKGLAEEINIANFANNANKEYNRLVNSDKVVDKYIKFLKFKTNDKAVIDKVRNSLRLMPVRDLEYLKTADFYVDKLDKPVLGSYKKESKILGFFTKKAVISINPEKANDTTFAHELMHDLWYKRDIYKTNTYVDLSRKFMEGSSLKIVDGYVWVESGVMVDSYQGRTYIKHSDFSGAVNPQDLKELITRGYQIFLTNPQKLKNKFIELYEAFEKGVSTWQ